MPTDLLGRGDFYHLEGRNHRGPACLVPSRRAVLAFPCPLSIRFASLRRPRDTCLMGQGSGRLNHYQGLPCRARSARSIRTRSSARVCFYVYACLLFSARPRRISATDFHVGAAVLDSHSPAPPDWSGHGVAISLRDNSLGTPQHTWLASAFVSPHSQRLFFLLFSRC
jgi:hypothetical protein